MYMIGAMPKIFFPAIALFLMSAVPSWAQDPAQPDEPPAETEKQETPAESDGKGEAKEKEKEKEKAREAKPVLTERVVVSASAATQSQLDAPAAVDVLDAIRPGSRR